MKPLKKLLHSNACRMFFGMVVLILIARSAVVLLPDCNLIPDFSSPWFAVAILLAITYRIVNAWGWTLVLRSMNRQVSGLLAARIWLRAESRRWLPGGVWGYASRAVQAKQLGVPAKAASASMLIELLVTVAAAMILFIPMLLVYRGEVMNAVGLIAEYQWLFWLALLAVTGGVVVSFLLRRKLAGKIRSLAQRIAVLRGLELDPHKLLTALGFFVLMGCLNGAVTWCLIASMTLTHYPPILVVIAATSFAWVAGFVAVFAPGGMVVREAVFATCLGLWMPYSSAMAIAILARVVQLVAEVLGMAWAYGAEWLPARWPASKPDTEPMVGL